MSREIDHQRLSRLVSISIGTATITAEIPPRRIRRTLSILGISRFGTPV